MNRPPSFCLLIAVALAPFAHGGQNAAPSSHLVYEGSFGGDILINEVRVPKDGEALYTYYEALGWGGNAAGYAGIQAHPKARNYIFSIWDHQGHSAPIKAVYHGPGTVTEKFGGEGTGLKSWNFELGWETDVWYTLVLRSWPVGDHTYFGYWVRSGKTGEWTHMVTMDVATKDAHFRGGNDSFIEDWLETGENARTTHLRGGWKRKLDGEWHAFQSARYSVNAWDLDEGKRSFNYRTNWNGGVAGDETGEFYFMTAGGKETKPTTTNPSRHQIKRDEETPGYPPINLLDAHAEIDAGGKLIVEWEPDPRTLPQFSFEVTVFENGVAEGKPVAKIGRVEPHARKIEWELPEKAARDAISIRVRCRDIFGNESNTLGMGIPVKK